MKIAFTTNQGKYGFSVFTDNEFINFKFVNAYEHEYDETHSWAMELGVTYSFRKSQLPTALSVAAEWVTDLVDDLDVTVRKGDIIIVAAVVAAILVLGPEIAAVVAGGAAINSVIYSLVATVLTTVKSFL